METIFAMVLVGLILGLTYALTSEGLWGAALMFFNVVFAGMIAFNFYEPLAQLLEKAGLTWGFNECLCLLVLLGVAIVVLTTYVDDSSVREALRAGARSYLTKDADRTDIARALHAAVGGLTVDSPGNLSQSRSSVGWTAGAGVEVGFMPHWSAKAEWLYLDLSDRSHLARAGLAIHGTTFEEHGRDNVVAATEVGQQVGQQVTASWRAIPEMVVRIDDRQVRFQHRLLVLGEPCGERGVIPHRGADICAFCLCNLGHSGFLRWFGG